MTAKNSKKLHPSPPSTRPQDEAFLPETEVERLGEDASTETAGGDKRPASLSEKRARRLERRDKKRLPSEPPDDNEPGGGPPGGGGPPPTGPGGSMNSLWYIGIALLIGMLALQFLGPSEGDEIKYGKLVELVEQGAPQQNPDAAIEIVRGEGEKQKTIRYSNLHDLTVGTYQITGKVTRQVVSPEKGDVEEDVSFHTGRGGLNFDDNYIGQLLHKNGFKDYSGADPPGFWEQYGPFVLTLLIFIPLFVLLFRRMGGAGAMAFGRSRGRFVAQEEIAVTFDDVAGVDEAVDELREVVGFLRRPEKYRSLGGRIPRGVLLVGPPGTGKTLLAKAVAGEANVPFFSLSGSDFVEMFVGVGAARVRDMFQQAQQRSPCIIFIDELDALGKTRGSSGIGGHDEREQTLNALLVEMDGFNSDSGTIIMAATNRPETLDPALMRPGRFDRQVLVDRPDIRGREAILKVHIKEVKVDDSVDVQRIAAITSGFVGADLAALVNEAALLAARAGKEAVTMVEFSEGVERVTTGLEKRQRVMQDDEKRRVAYHESGHALIAWSLPNVDPVHKVSIIPRGMAALGYTMQRPQDDRYLLTKSELESRIQVLLAGIVAEEIVFDDVSTGAQNDLERATEIARAMVMDFGMSRLGPVTYRENPRATFLGQNGFAPPRLHSEQTAREIDEEIRHIIESLLGSVQERLKDRFDDLERLSALLLEREVLDSEELHDLLETQRAAATGGEPSGDACRLRCAGAPSDDAATEADGDSSGGGDTPEAGAAS